MAILAAAGCLQKTTSHTLYLSPDGAVLWSALERDVYSDESSPDARQTEEEAYLNAAVGGTHGVATALTSQVLRRQRPFTVLTEAEFGRIDRLFERMLAECGVRGSATLRHEGTRTTLAVVIDTRGPSDADSSEALEALAEDVDHYRIVLTAGRFVSAAGFRLTDQDTAAVPLEMTDAEISASGGIVHLTLSWEQ
jgi:hypothetical protein